MLNLYTHHDPSGSTVVMLDVRVDGWTVHVSKGSFRILGQDHQLGDDEKVLLEPAHERYLAEGLLVRVKTSGDIRLLVDVYPLTGGGLNFSDSSCPYELLYQLFNATVPVGASSLAEARVNVFRHLLAPVRPQEVSRGT